MLVAAIGGVITLAVVAFLLVILIIGLAQTEDALRVWARRQRAALVDQKQAGNPAEQTERPERR